MKCQIEYLRRKTSCLLFVMFVILYLCLSAVAFGQGVPEKQDDLIKLGTTLVQVPVVVSDFGGRYIADLGEKDFTVYEDGIKQQISYFGSIEEPFTVALLLDSSGSTQSQLNVIKQAAQAFIDNLRPQDRGLIIVFNDSVEVVCELTGDKSLMSKAIEKIRPGEFTQVYEAVYTAVWDRLQDVDGRKAIILFTDGIDTASSEISDEDTFNAVVESEDVIIYPVRFSTRGDVEAKLRNRGMSSLGGVGRNGSEDLTNHILELDRAYRRADEYLYELANLSGGVVERADKITDLKFAFGRIAEELRHQYIIGYYPTNREKTNLMHRIDVRVNRPSVKVRFRPGYKNLDH
jgi:Ca-activated chloride channel family protein